MLNDLPELCHEDPTFPVTDHPFYCFFPCSLLSTACAVTDEPFPLYTLEVNSADARSF